MYRLVVNIILCVSLFAYNSFASSLNQSSPRAPLKHVTSNLGGTPKLQNLKKLPLLPASPYSNVSASENILPPMEKKANGISSHL